MEMFKDLPVIHFESADEFAGWLDKNHEEPVGAWLKSVIPKKRKA
jgi:hypothetical protein